MTTPIQLGTLRGKIDELEAELLDTKKALAAAQAQHEAYCHAPSAGVSISAADSQPDALDTAAEPVSSCTTGPAKQIAFSKMRCDQLELAAHDLRRRAIAAARKHSSVQAALDKAMNAAAGQHQTQQECMLAAEASKSQLLLDIDGALSKETATQAALLHCALRIHDLEAELAEVHQQSLISAVCSPTCTHHKSEFRHLKST